MNIKITHNWLLEYLDTDSAPEEIRKYVTLSGPSVEKVEKEGDDYVYDIEVTSNRIDTASVYGFAQECQAILPLNGKKARLKFNLAECNFQNSEISVAADKLPLDVQISGNNLCTRFSAKVFENISIKHSPVIVADRLRLCGINTINNVVDISNYLMLALGQPIHMFDYDRIAGHRILMRESRKGEKLTTLDGKELELPGGDIVIEDASGKLIDLCGIMGGENSAITPETKRVVLFVQTYNKTKIRRTSMLTGQRSLASTYFEKGLDEERVEPTMVKGEKLLRELAGGSAASKLYDIYPEKYKSNRINISLAFIREKMGVDIGGSRVREILQNLGFSLEEKNNSFNLSIPSFRKHDVEIPEDIIEEISRIYGYHNIPAALPPPAYVRQPEETEKLFLYQSQVKRYLAAIGMNEVLNYSMVSGEQISQLGMSPADSLRLSNALSKEIEFLRTSLVPSLVKNVADNEGRKENIKLFEIAKTYMPRSGELPDEEYRLGLIVNTGYGDLKGIFEALMRNLHIDDFRIKPASSPLLQAGAQIEILIANKKCGFLGRLNEKLRNALKLQKPVFVAEISLSLLIENAKTMPKYAPINPYAVIKLDTNIKLDAGNNYEIIKGKALLASQLIEKMELVSVYKDALTLRFYFNSPDHNLTEEEAKVELAKINEAIRK